MMGRRAALGGADPADAPEREEDAPMKLTARTVDGVTVVRLDESLEAGNAHSFLEYVASIAEKCPRIALDLRRLAFIDSFGLQSLISCLRRIRSAGGDIKLFNASKRVRLTLKLVRMNRVMDVLDTQAEAVEALKDTGGN